MGGGRTMKTIAVILSGCGNKDGAEVTEVVSTLIAISAAGAKYELFAPNIDYHPMNHLNGEIDTLTLRNTLIEAARLARGQIKDLNQLKEADYEAIVFPGGFGAAIHLSNWAQKGAKCIVHSEVVRVIQEFHQASKPIGAICIAPTLIAKVLGGENVTLTIGNDKETSAEISKTGAIPVDCPVDDFITDRLHKVITTPAYMYDTLPDKVFKGISRLINELVEMA